MIDRLSCTMHMHMHIRDRIFGNHCCPTNRRHKRRHHRHRDRLRRPHTNANSYADRYGNENAHDHCDDDGDAHAAPLHDRRRAIDRHRDAHIYGTSTHQLPYFHYNSRLSISRKTGVHFRFQHEQRRWHSKTKGLRFDIMKVDLLLRLHYNSASTLRLEWCTDSLALDTGKWRQRRLRYSFHSAVV